MDLHSAREAIGAILAAVPDGDLPAGRLERDGDDRILWYGGVGHHLGSSRTNGKRNPEAYRRTAVDSALEYEACYRADARLLTEEGV